MAVFNIGETIICSVDVKDDAGAYKDPATSMKIVVARTKPNYIVVVASTDMTKDSVGKYHYDFQTSTAIAGSYEATYTATDGSRITIEKDTFEVE